MLVYYNDDGTVTSVHRGPAEWAPAPDHAAIDLPDQDLVDLGGLRVVAGALVRSSLDTVRSIAVGQVNDRIGRARLTLVPDILGQAQVDFDKQDEARAFVADPAPNLADYPLLAAETGPGLTAPDAWSLAQIWLNEASQRRSALAPIEGARSRALGAISAATTESEIAAALAALEGSLP